MLRILVLHGPNLNLLGTREQSIYGTQSLENIDSALTTLAEHLGLHIDTRQSNSEGDLVNWIQESGSGYDGIIINPAGWTFTSDDHVVLGAAPDGRLWVEGLPRTFHLDAGFA